MNPFALLIQAFANGQVQDQAERIRLAGVRAAETGRRVAITGAFFSLAALFIFCGILLAIIELGLQVDRGNGVSFSGLMLSSTILVFIGGISLFVGWLTSRQPDPPPPPPPPPAMGFGFAKSELFSLLEQIAVTFLKDFLEKHNAKKSQAPPPNNP